MSFSSLIKRWFGKHQGTMRNSRHGPIQTRKKSAARKSVNLMLEILEDRVVPATVSYTSSLVELDLTAGAGETISVTTTSNQIQIQLTNTTDTITLAGGAASNSNFVLSDSNSTLTINKVNSGGVSIGDFNVYLANQKGSPDTLTFELENLSTGISTVNIGAAASASITTDSASGGVGAGSATVTPATMEPYITNAAVLLIQSGQSDQEAVQVSAPPTSTTFTATYGLSHSADFTIAPAVPQTDTEDTVTLNNSSVWTLSQLTVSAETIDFQGPVLSVAEFSLTSVNSLIFTSTGVPFTGAVTINAPPAAMQPFAGDSYLTGPDWGSYGYAPGDSITISNAVNVSSSDFIVAGIVGDNLYLTTALAPDANGKDSDVTVAANFTPQIQAPLSLTLDVTGTASTISGAIAATALKATTQNGNVTLQDVDALPMVVESLNAGTGTIQLDASAIFGATGDGINLTAGAVELTTTGPGGSIGSSSNSITTAIDGPLTATTSDGGVYIADMGPGLTINSVVADQGGQPAVVSNGQVLYNSTPSLSSPTYIFGNEDVTISSTGPIVLNSITATGNVTITSSAYILQGNAQSSNVVAQEVDLTAEGTADYQGLVTFANTTSASGDTMTLPATIPLGDSTVAGPTWNYLGFAAGDTIYVYGAGASADDGAFTVKKVSDYVLTLTQSFVLAPQTPPEVTVGNGMIGLVNAPISLSDVPLFSATTANGGIYLETGSGVDSTAANVYAGGMNDVVNNASVTSQANFLTIENITATGNAAVTMNSGSLFEYPGATYNGEFDLFQDTSDDYTILGTDWTAAGFEPGDVITISGATGVNSTTDYVITSIVSGDILNFTSDQTLPGQYVPSGTVTALGDITGQNVSLTSPYNIGTASSPMLTNAASGLTVSATATSPSSAAVYVNNISPLSSVGVSTYDGSADVQSGQNASNYNDSLSFNNSVLSETGPANTLVTFSNTDNNGGSNDDVIISGPVYVSAISAGISSGGIAGAGQILSLANSGATIDGDGGAVILSAGSGIGIPGTLSGTSIDIMDVATLDATTNTGGIYIQDTSDSPMTLIASTSNGDIYVMSAGEIDLSGNEGTSSTAVTLDSVSATGTVNLDAGGAIVDVDNAPVYASTLVLTATDAIGTASNPLETSGPGTLTLTATGDGLFLDNSTALTVDSATAGSGDLAISATGNLTLQGDVSSSGNVTLTATGGSLTTSGTVLISAGSLTISAEQIGSPSDFIQTSATTINATANYGGIYLSNSNTANLTLSAASVGPILPTGATNNIDIYSAGNIVLLPLMNTLTELATALPVAILNPGGMLTLLAGETLSADGTTPPTIVNSSDTVTSADASENPATYFDVYTGTYTITHFSDNFSTSSSGGLDSNWTVQSGSFAVNTTSQTATATDTSPINLATVSSVNSVNESASATISGTLGSGQTAGLVALFSSLNSYYYGAIAATSSSAYTASIYSVVGGIATALVTESYTTGLVSNEVLEFSAAGSSLTLTFGGSVVASATISSTATAGVVGMLASSGVSFSNFSTSPPLQILSNTAEILVSLPGSTSSTDTLLELTATELENAVAPFVAGTIEIEDLGTNGLPGMITVNGDLVLDATAGPVTFENPGDTIEATGTITIEADDVADLGNLISTAYAGPVTVDPPVVISISAGGNISVGTIDAGAGTVLITSSSGAVYSSVTDSTTLSVTAGLLALHSSAQSSASSAQSASSAASAAQSASVQDQLNAAEAAATAQAAAAEAAADQTTAAAFKTAMTSMQNAVTIANLTYQTDEQATTTAGDAVNVDQNVVNGESIAVDIIDGIAGVAQTVSASLGIAAAIADTVGYETYEIPILGEFDLTFAGILGLASAFAGLTEGIADDAAFAASSALTAASIQLSKDETTASNAQSAQDDAYAQWQADMDSETAFAAAYNVAEQAYTTALATSNQDEMASQTAQQAAAVAEANAVAATQAASVAATTSAPPTLNVAGPLPSVPGPAEPGPVSIVNAAGASGLNWTNSITSNSSVMENTTGPITISGVTINAGMSVTLAGSNVDIASGSTIEATSTITITGNTDDALSGATVTVDGTLSAPSALIGVDSGATGNETFTITPSATSPTTQITVDGGSDSGGNNTLNYNAAGLSPTLTEISPGEYTITATDVQPVTFSNIEIVNITNSAGGGSFTLMGLSGAANTMNLLGTGQGAGTATLSTAMLNSLAVSFNGMTSFDYEGGGVVGGAGDMITVTPYVASRWNLAVTVAGGAGSPASLTYNSVDSLADTVTATSNYEGSIGSAGAATIQFSNVNEVTANASQSPDDALTVNLPDGSSTDMANLISVGGGIANIQFDTVGIETVELFGLNVDTTDYTAGLTINGNTVAANNLDLGIALPIALTLSYPDTHIVANTGAATSVEATASGDQIVVTSAGLVEVGDSEVAVTDTQLQLNDLGNNDTITIAGNHPFTNGIYVNGNASFSDVMTFAASSDAAVTVTPSTSTVSQAGSGSVYYAGIQTLNLTASGSTSTLTVNGAGTADAFDFTQTGPGSGSFTVDGPGEALDISPLFNFTGFGIGATVEDGTSLGQPLSVPTMTGNPATITGTLATVTGYSYVNESISATMTLTTGQYAGLAARYTGAGEQNMDLGFIVAGGSGYTAYIYQNVNGTWTQLFTQTDSGSVSDETLEFETAGSSLTLSLGGKIIGYAQDTVLNTTAGSVGTWMSSGAAVSNFVAAPVTLQASSSPTTFSDNFSTAGDASQLSTYWSIQAGSFQVNSGTAMGVGSMSTPDLATVNGMSSANESVSATVTVAVGECAGLVARYTGPGDQNMDVGVVRVSSSGYTAYIYQNINGTWTPLFTQAYGGSVSDETLVFDAVGSSLTLSLGGSIIGYAQDTVLNTTAGSVGMRASGGAVLSDFSATPATPQNSSSSTTFSDNFSTAGAASEPSTYWSIQTGSFQVNTSTDTAMGVGPMSTLDLATVNGMSGANESVSATLTVAAGECAGLVARYTGPGDQNMDDGVVRVSSSGYTAYIYQDVNGTWTPLFTQTYGGSVSDETLVFDAVGSSLTLSLGGTIIAYAQDTVLNTTAGSVGMRASGGAVLSDFSATPATPQNSASSTTFSDNFSTAGAASEPSTFWSIQAGSFQVDTSSGTAMGLGSISALDLATVNGMSSANESVSAIVTVSGGEYAGLVARYAGAADQNMYAGFVNASNTGYTAYIEVNVGGVWSELYSSQTYSGSVNKETMEFDAVGTSLQLFLNGSIVAYANDTALPGAGSVGMLTSGSAVMSNFEANPMTPQNSASSTTYSDNFSTAGDASQLSTYWSSQAGSFKVDTSGGTATGVGSASTINLATVNGISSVNESVSATVTVTAGEFAGLVTRYAGAGDQNMDFGFVMATSSGYTAYIYQNIKGTWTQLSAQTYGGSVTDVALEFEAAGSSLTLSLGGSIIASATDTVLNSTAGSVGMRTSGGGVMSNFSAIPVTLQTSSSSTTFSDNFSTAGDASQPSTYWSIQAGSFQVDTSGGTAMGFRSASTIDLATVNGINNANESVSATVTVAAGQFAGLVARYAGAGDQNMDFGFVMATSSGNTAYIYQNLNGTWTQLVAQTYGGSVTNATMEFDAVGTSLTLTLNSTIIATATDTVLGAGSVGMRTSGGAIVSSFNANPS